MVMAIVRRYEKFRLPNPKDDDERRVSVTRFFVSSPTLRASMQPIPVKLHVEVEKIIGYPNRDLIPGTENHTKTSFFENLSLDRSLKKLALN